MIRIAITVEAFEAISSTLPVGSVMYETETNAKGERMIWAGAEVRRQRRNPPAGGGIVSPGSASD
jgi:hypothetical protein